MFCYHAVQRSDATKVGNAIHRPCTKANLKYCNIQEILVISKTVLESYRYFMYA